MKKFLAVVAFLAMVTGVTFAATDSLTINGKVAEKLDIDFAETGDLLFNLTEAGVGTITTGDVTIYSNRKAYVIRIDSANDWELVSGDTLNIDYLVKVVAGASNPIVFGTSIANNLSTNGTPASTDAIISATNYRTAGATFKLVFETAPTANTFYDYDRTYTDTITLTISAT